MGSADKMLLHDDYAERFHPRVSVVIPVYNGANYLAQAIDSALAQTYSDVEVLVINDGSRDGGDTERIARRYGDQIRYVYKDNGGVASALNVGIREMTGEYLSWLSHDDVYHPDKIKVQVECLRESKNRDAVLYSAYTRIDADTMVLDDDVDALWSGDPFLDIFYTRIGGCTTLVSRRCFDVVGLFNEQLPTTQDNEMWLRIFLAGFEFRFIPRALIQTRDHAEQGSRTIRSHAAERESSYIRAIDVIGPELRQKYAESIATVVLQKEHPRAFLHLLKAMRRDCGAVNAWRLFAPRVSVFARTATRQKLRSVPWLVRLKRWVSPPRRAAAGPPAQRSAAIAG